MLKIEHLTKNYGEKKAVDDLSLHILPGEIFGFIGHNGAGKSTTIKSAVGILKFDEGMISIFGAAPYMACWSILLALVSFVLLKWLDTGGAEAFSSL